MGASAAKPKKKAPRDPSQIRVPGTPNEFEDLGLLEYLWYIPYRIILAVIYPPSYAIGRLLARQEDIASWVHIYLQGMQMVLGAGFLVFGALYISTASIYLLQNISIMHIVFLCTMIPLSLILLFSEYGISLMRDPLHPDRHIHPWHPGIVVVIAEIGEIYGTLMVACLLCIYIQVLDLVTYGITRQFNTTQDYTAYHFVGLSLGLIMWITASTLYSRTSVREREMPAVFIKELPPSMQSRRRKHHTVGF